MRSPADSAIGVDVGGTRIRAARIGADGQVLDHRPEPTDRTRDGFCAQIRRLVAALRDDDRRAVGVGLPGRVDGGGQDARAILSAWAAPLGRTLQSLVATLDPGLIVVAGGRGAALARALGALPRASPRFPLPLAAARLGDEAGVVGAGLSALGMVRDA
jgi:predicted NBD/HSP70 family sugar kinase